MEDKRYLSALTLSQQALSFLPKEYTPAYTSTWAFHCQEGLVYLGLNQHDKAEDKLKLAKTQLNAIFNKSSPHFNQKESEDITTYALVRVKEIYHYLAEAQQSLGKHNSAKNTREEGRVFLNKLEVVGAKTEINKMRIEL